MIEYKSPSRHIFIISNYLFLSILAALSFFPLLQLLSISLSSGHAAAAGLVKLFPVEFSISSYEFALTKPEFIMAFMVSVKRILLGVSINMILTVLVAYPLSKEVRDFPWRTVYAWIFIFSMLFDGGLIPTYMVVRNTGLLDTIWSLILPGAVPVFNVVLMLNFFRSLPKALEEAALIDGASFVQTLLRIYLPLSMPGLATIGLFTIVGHWNSFFDGLIYMNSPLHYPLQSYLQTMLNAVSKSSFDPAQLGNLHNIDLSEITDRTYRASQIFLAMLPILLIYPFLQRFFMVGIVLGSVKE